MKSEDPLNDAKGTDGNIPKGISAKAPHGAGTEPEGPVFGRVLRYIEGTVEVLLAVIHGINRLLKALTEAVESNAVRMALVLFSTIGLRTVYQAKTHSGEFAEQAAAHSVAALQEVVEKGLASQATIPTAPVEVPTQGLYGSNSNSLAADGVLIPHPAFAPRYAQPREALK